MSNTACYMEKFNRNSIFFQTQNSQNIILRSLLSYLQHRKQFYLQYKIVFYTTVYMICRALTYGRVAHARARTVFRTNTSLQTTAGCYLFLLLGPVMHHSLTVMRLGCYYYYGYIYIFLKQSKVKAPKPPRPYGYYYQHARDFDLRILVPN